MIDAEEDSLVHERISCTKIDGSCLAGATGIVFPDPACCTLVEYRHLSHGWPSCCCCYQFVTKSKLTAALRWQLA